MKTEVTAVLVAVLCACTLRAEPVRTGVYAGPGVRSNGCTEWYRLVDASPDLELVLIDEKAIVAGGLSAVDVFVMPGGDSRTVKRGLGSEGPARIRDFVRNGGGYIGTCAGCCLALDERLDPERGIGLIPYRRIGHNGHAMLPMRLNEAGAAALGMKAGEYPIRYSRGPVMERVAPTAEMKIETWGEYARDIDLPKTKLAMTGRPALAGGTFGKGKVFAIALHPESFPCTREFVRGAFRFVTGREVTFPERVRRAKSLVAGVFTPVICGAATAKTILAIDRMDGVDLFPIAFEEIERGMLDHVDVLVLPDGRPDFYRNNFKDGRGAFLAAFAGRGGRVFAWGAGAEYLPERGRAFASAADLLAALEGER